MIKDPPFGTIKSVVTYDIYCALCKDDDSVGELNDLREDAIKAARKKGWSKTKEHGWICPECKKKCG